MLFDFWNHGRTRTALTNVRVGGAWTPAAPFGRGTRPACPPYGRAALVVAIIALVSLSTLTTLAATPTITGVTAQQRYPWNGKVDITYTVTGDVIGYALTNKLVTTIKVTARDKVANKSYTALPAALSGDPTFTTGIHSIVWNLDYQGIVLKSTNVEFNVSCETTTALLYCVIDLSEGADATSYPITYLSKPPSGGFVNDTYRTTQLVLRRCEAGTFIMGSDQTDESHRVWLTKPFYMSIFEVTQKQWKLVMGSWSAAQSSDVGDVYPVFNVSFYDICGTYYLYSEANRIGKRWPSSADTDTWGAVAWSDNMWDFMSKLRTRTMLDFDLPTQAQWEYACLAGTTDVEAGGAWCYPDAGLAAHPGGGKAGNSWGLYDMRGNVAEWTLDYSGTLVYGTDPMVKSGSNRVLRGGNWQAYASGCKSYSRSSAADSYKVRNNGFRLVMNLP